jgi:hypothetical protein
VSCEHDGLVTVCVIRVRCALQLYFKALRHKGIPGVPPDFFPLLLFVCAIIWGFLPWSRRKGVWLTVKDVVISPFAPSSFRETFVGDVLTSIVKLLTDILYTFCFFFTGAWLLLALLVVVVVVVVVVIVVVVVVVVVVAVVVVVVVVVVMVRDACGA